MKKKKNPESVFFKGTFPFTQIATEGRIREFCAMNKMKRKVDTVPLFCICR